NLSDEHIQYIRRREHDGLNEPFDDANAITGWPGGKPNADDTHRPERAKPYPKRVIIFRSEEQDICPTCRFIERQMHLYPRRRRDKWLLRSW
ncbi:hypothetical protein, partial [Bacteroides sp. 51]|uniref:hypothetical protein n=1 Tax=Bacteroides sp. 51 TaxID=2302938 RepID=UPI0013D83468